MSAPPLTEDEIDDILYYARTNSLPALTSLLASLSSHGPPPSLLTHATDPSTGNSALHMCAANGHTESTQYILSHAPLLSKQQNHAGSTPLHYAALNGRLEVVKALVEIGGAGVGVRNGAGRTALDEAEEAGHGGVGAWLLGRMGSNEEVEVETEGRDGAVNGVSGGDGGEEGEVEVVNGASGEGEERREGKERGDEDGEGKAMPEVAEMRISE